MNYSFGEKDREYYNGNYLPVFKSPKYEQTKEKVVEILTSGKYKDLCPADFWILMNTTKGKDKMQYSGLIISHNGCLKINDVLENKVDPNCFTYDKEGYKNSLVFIYKDSDTYEVGEVSEKNCKNEYPYAMAFKRCFDRVVLKKSRLAYAGVYSEAEADEFREPVQEKKAVKVTMAENEKNNLKIKPARLMSDENYERLKEALIDKFGGCTNEKALNALEATCKAHGIMDMKKIPDEFAEEIIVEIINGG